MKLFCTAVLLFSLGQSAAFAHPPKSEDHGVLTSGQTITIQVRQVITKDGLSRGERMLNGQHPLQAGDMFTAELPTTPGQPGMILVGCVSEVIPPRRFGRPGKVSIQLAWPSDPSGNQSTQWQFDVEDQRFSSAHKRRAITTLFLAEGFAVGASVGSTLDRGKAATTLGAGGVGLLLGVAYASLQPGHEGSLEPGDRLAVVVGTSEVRKLPPEVPLTVYPAHEPEKEKHMKRSHTTETSR